jgi:hypothetical protein
MALISSTTIISSVSLFHMTLAYFLLAKPSTIDDQTLVFMVGESVGIPETIGFAARSHALGFLAAVLALFGFSDLISLTMPAEVALLYYWGTQAPFRFLFSMAACLYIFFTGPTSPFAVSVMAPAAERRAVAHAYSPDSINLGWGGEALKNRAVFTFLFVEMIAWFWVWSTIREERPAIIEQAIKDNRQHGE